MYVKNLFKQFEQNKDVIYNINNYKIVVLFDSFDFKRIQKILDEKNKENLIFIAYGNKDFFKINDEDVIFFNLQEEVYNTYAMLYNNYIDTVKELLKFLFFKKRFNFVKYIDDVNDFELFKTKYYKMSIVLNNKLKVEKLLKKYFISMAWMYKILKENWFYKILEEFKEVEEEIPF